jgi:short-subunit dehydrogenase
VGEPVKRVVIVGGTDGIGAELVKLYAARGCDVAVIGRSPEKLEAVARSARSQHPGATVATIVCDLGRNDEVEPAFNAALAALGHADLVIYVAGVLRNDDGVTSRFADDRETLQVNVMSAVHMLGLAANYFGAAGRGHIAAISSVAGERGRKRQPAYCASKAALNTYLEGLRNRLATRGVTVTTVKPGFVATRMIAGRGKLPWVVEPDWAARVIARKLDRRVESFFLPARWAAVALALRLMPSFIFKRIGPP